MILTCVLLALVLGIAQAGVLEHEERVLRGRPLSEKNRDDGDDYDHDAFLGEDDAEYFDNLDPEESQRRLGVIFDQIDKDYNGKVNLDELQRWIQFVQEREIREDTETQWEEKNRGKKELINLI